MRILSPVEAISPAFERTKLVLFTPFRKGRTWKLSVTAYLSFAGTIFLPFTLVYAAVALAFTDKIGHGLAWGIATGCVVLTAIYVFLFVLLGRLKFAFFDIVLNRGEFVAPAWRKYKQASWRWTNVKMIVGTIFTLVMAAPVFFVVRNMIRMAPALSQMRTMPGEAPPPELINFMISFYGVYFLVMLVVGAYYLVITTVSSFVVPTMALENASVREAFRRFTGLVQRETGQFFLYVAMRVLIGVVGYMGLVFAYEIVLFLLMAVAALIFGLIGLVLHLVGVPMTVLTVLGFLAFGAFMFLVNGYLLVLLMGGFFTFFEAHTLYFLGGRYPLLGELLEKSTPPPPPPAYWPADFTQPNPVP